MTAFKNHSRNKFTMMGIPLNLEKNTNEEIRGDAKFCSLRKLVIMILGGKKKTKKCKRRRSIFLRERKLNT